MSCIYMENNDIAPIPMEGQWISLKELSQINGVSHGVGGCPPHQGACKLTTDFFSRDAKFAERAEFARNNVNKFSISAMADNYYSIYEEALNV